MTGNKASPMRANKAAAHRISNNSFDPDASAKECARQMILYNAWAEMNGLGVRFLSSMRSTEVRELWPGAAKEAESDVQIGWLLKRLRADGFGSGSPAVLEALEARGLQQRNSKRKKDLRKARNTRPARDFAEAVNKYIDQSTAVLDAVAAGSALIDRDVRASPDCRDVPVEWPHRVVGNMAVPLQPKKPK
jgi:hypothetical protein